MVGIIVSVVLVIMILVTVVVTIKDYWPNIRNFSSVSRSGLNIYQTNDKSIVKADGKVFTGKGKVEITNGVVIIGGKVVGEIEDDGGSITIG